MAEDIEQTGARHVDDMHAINRRFMEKALQLQCLGYIAQAKARLLTETIFEIDASKKVLWYTNQETERQRKMIAKQKALLEQKNNELAIARDRAEESDRLKTAFLAVMSHELRTPLNSIIGFTDIVLQGLAGPLSEEQARQLGMVLSSARHLHNLVNDVLDISRIEAGEVEIVPEDFEVREAIEKAVQKVIPMAENKGLALSVEVAPEVDRIVSDRRRVEQILINLVNNAVKFTEHGEVRIECCLSEDRLVIRVKDSGIGINPEDLDKLFIAFQQLETGLNRKQEGTGLGLSICKKLVDLLGG